MADVGAVGRIWAGRGVGPRLARALLAPAAALYRGGVAVRGALYDAGVLQALDTALPAVSVGNLSVGGTGKTPIAAWLAGELHRRGARPAIVLRGYGDDEPLVHRLLAPEAIVVVAADRVRGVGDAHARGADVAVLDDAFQHRRARRVADIVLVSADRWDASVRLLPAGPWREPLGALRRASLALVTRKAADAGTAQRVARALADHAPSLPIGVVRLALDELARPDGTRAPLHVLRGATVLAVAAIGEPIAFVRQLEALGARVRPALFRDHHRFDGRDVARLRRLAASCDVVVCTLKDAVKLDRHWPRAAPAFWYVSQRVTVERGSEALDEVLARVLAARLRQSDSTPRHRRPTPAHWSPP